MSTWLMLVNSRHLDRHSTNCVAARAPEDRHEPIDQRPSRRALVVPPHRLGSARARARSPPRPDRPPPDPAPPRAARPPTGSRLVSLSQPSRLCL